MKLRMTHEVRWAKVEPGDDGPPSGATDEDLALINAMPEVIVPRTQKNVFVRRVYGVHDGPLHGGKLQLATDAVQWLGSNAKGVKLMANHITSAPGMLPYGFIFKGGVESIDGKNWGVFDVALPRSAGNLELIERMDGGAISEVSVQLGFEALKCSECGKEAGRCRHEPGEKGVRAIVTGANDFIELSFVMAGKVPGTRMAIAASRDADYTAIDEMLRAAAPDPMDGLFAKQEAEPEGSAMSHLFA